MSITNLKEVELHEDNSTENNSEFVTYQYILPIQVLNDNSLNQFMPSGYILKTLENGALVLEENSVFNDNNSSALVQINSATKSTTQGTNESNIPLLIQDVKQQMLETTKTNEPFQLRTNLSKNDSDNGIDSVYIIPENLFTCELCNESFEKKIHLKKHKTQHLNDKPHKCTECAASFNILSNLNLHKIIHQKNVLKCPECGKTFTRSASLKAHLIVHEKEEIINCPSCEDSFDTQLLLKEHINSCHKIKLETEVQTPQKCKICYKSFDDHLSYKSHLRDHNKVRRILTKFKYPFRSSGRKTNVKLKHECSVCKKAFQKHSQLIRHIRIHTGERPFKCNLCNLAFSQNNTLKIHMTKHTGIRPHSCSLCPAKFSQRGNLRNHILRVHSIENSENVYECNECSCKFRKLGTLNAHMNRMHCNKEDTNNTTESDVQVLCKELNSLNENCDPASESSTKKNAKSELNYWAIRNEKSYASYRITVLADKSVDGTVRRHMIRQRKVGNVRWHQCSYCPKEFKKPSDVVRHIRIHTREKPFKCNYCSRCFTVQSTLTSHLRTHQSSNNGTENGASFKCDICDKLFPNLLCWNNHNKKNHQVICQICNKSYRTQEQLAIHSQSHSLSEESKCTVCDKIFPTPEQLNLHSRSHKKKKKDDETLYKSVSLQEPIVIIQDGYIQAPVSSKNRPIVEANSHFRPHKCTNCGAAFRKSSHLKQHLIIHSTEKPFACTKCDSVFRYAHAVKNHMRTHDNSSKSFVCEQCNSCFTTSGSLRRHHIAQHSTVRPYMCPYCQKTFKLSTSCRKHIKIHRSEIYRKQQDSMAESNVLDITVTAEPTAENITEIEADKNMNLVEENTDCNNPIVNMPFESTEEVTISRVPEPVSSATIVSDQLIQTLFTNKNVLTDMNTNARQDDITIEDSLNQQLYNIVGSDGVVDATMNEKERPVGEEITLNTLQNDNNLPTENETYLPILESENPPYTVIFDLNNPIVINVTDVLDQFKTKTPDGIQNTVEDIQDFQNIDENNIIITTNMNNILPSQLSTQDKIDTQALSTENKNGASNKIQFMKRKSKLIRSQKCKQKYKFVKVRNHHSPNQKTDEPKDELENETISELTTKKNKCNVCPKSFRKPSDLERHIRTHTGEKPFQCTTCQKRFSLNSTLKSHLKVHLGEKNFLCQVCNSLFSTKGSLNVHMRLHTGVKPFKCQFCDRHFRTSGHRQAHHQSHLKQAKRTNSKPNSEISRGIKLRTLFSESVASISDSAKSENVNETVIDKNIKKENIVKDSNLSKIRKMDNSGNISNVCYMINDKVSSIVDSNQHTEISSEILEHLQTTDNQTLIEDNALTLNNQEWYDIQTDENGQIVNIQPSINPSLFTDPLDLQIPSQTLLTTSAEDSDMNPSCTAIVDAEFIEASDYQAVPLKTYDCLECNKSFNKPSKLERHFRIHTGERPFTCEYCNKTFNQTNALNMHLRTHSGTKPHQCPYCSHTSTQKGNMKTHLLRAHDVTTLPKQLVNPLNTSIVIQSNDGSEAILKLEGDWNAS